MFVAGGGCSGYQYGMALARSAEDDDIVLDQQGVRILVDPRALSTCRAPKSTTSTT